MSVTVHAATNSELQNFPLAKKSRIRRASSSIGAGGEIVTLTLPSL